jgi:hypothetical protein
MLKPEERCPTFAVDITRPAWLSFSRSAFRRTTTDYITMTLSDISRKLPINTTLATLGGDSYFTVVNQGGEVIIINSGGSVLALDDAHVLAVFNHYNTLPADRRLMAGEYVDPLWPQCPSRIFSPYVARLIDYAF